MDFTVTFSESVEVNYYAINGPPLPRAPRIALTFDGGGSSGPGMRSMSVGVDQQV